MLAFSDLALLRGAPAEALRLVAPYVSRRMYAAGQVIVFEGDPCREVYFVAEGLVRLRQVTLEGREHVLSYVGPDGALNLAAVLDGGHALAGADAVTDSVVYAVPCDRFREAMRASQEVSEAVALTLARENRRLAAMVRDLALYSVRARLARFLLQHAEYEPPQERWTQSAIASSIGTVRDVVGRALRAFADEGLIRRERGRLRIADRERLEEIAHEQ